MARPPHHAAADHAAPGVSSLLDIGGEVGALVVYLPAPPPSGELEACPTGQPSARFHTGVHLRETGVGPAHVALFPSVLRGVYDVLGEAGTPIARVAVPGGAVSEIDLRVD
jgi:hypothetical protein